MLELKTVVKLNHSFTLLLETVHWGSKTETQLQKGKGYIYKYTGNWVGVKDVKTVAGWPDFFGGGNNNKKAQQQKKQARSGVL